SAGENGNTGAFTFRRTGDLSVGLIVQYAVSGTAGNGTDYELLSGTAIFAEGAATTTVTVNPIDDTLEEGNETIRIDLATAMHYSNAFNSTTAVITLADNDAPQNLGTLSWSQKASNPVPRSEGYGAVVGGRLYTFGGYLNSQYRPSKVAHVYDPATNRWTQLRDAPLELTHAAAAHDDRYIYVAGGYPPGSAGPNGPQAFASNRVFRYDTTNDTWISLPNLPAARGSGQMVLIGRTLYFFGGSDAARKDRADHWALNLDNLSAGWITRAPMPAARNHFGAAAVGGFAYAVGGQTGQDLQAVFHANVYRYDPVSNTWTSVASLPSPARSHANASTFVHKGRILSIGGEVANYSPVAHVDAYNPATNTWSRLTALPTRTTAGIAASFGDTIIFTTGAAGGQFRGTTWIGSFT
ncbi:MAG: hypothetical protein NZ561_02585, partial [Phycisphaerae bacterium]|nr:hypothetical protein [Phycisphaerae bacterium]